MQEVRGYTLAMLLSTATILAWLHAVETDRVRWWAAFAGVGSASLYAHFFCGLVIGALVVLIAAGTVPRTRGMGAALAVVLLAAIPLVFFVLFEDTGQVDWIPVLSPDLVGDVIGALAGGSIALLALLIIGIVLALARRPDRWSPGRVLLAAWLLVPISSRDRHIDLEAAPRAALPDRRRSAADVARRRRAAPGSGPGPSPRSSSSPRVALSIGPLAARADDIGEDWRSAAGWVASVAKPGDRVVYQIPSGEKPFRWYLDTIPGVHPADATLDDVRTVPGRVWLVLYKMDLAQHQALLATLPDLKVDQSKAFDGMRVQLLVPASP